MSFKDILVERARKSKLMKKIYLKVFSPYVDLHVRELSLTFDLQPAENESKRLNLLVPSISREHVFGGITTAFDYFNRIAGAGGFQKRSSSSMRNRAMKRSGNISPVTGWPAAGRQHGRATNTALPAGQALHTGPPGGFIFCHGMVDRILRSENYSLAGGTLPECAAGDPLLNSGL